MGQKSTKKAVRKYTKKECLHCGEPFETHMSWQKYCQNQCAVAASEARRAGNGWVILNRDGFRCVYCGKSTEDSVKLTLDHILPVSKGGGHSAGNLLTCCSPCNSARGAQPLSESSISHIRERVARLNSNFGISDSQPIKASATYQR